MEKLERIWQEEDPERWTHYLHLQRASVELCFFLILEIYFFLYLLFLHLLYVLEYVILKIVMIGPKFFVKWIFKLLYCYNNF